VYRYDVRKLINRRDALINYRMLDKLNDAMKINNKILLINIYYWCIIITWHLV